ncbi:Zn(II)2Cys6 transcription factor [Aspergillus foveolatus]|uniref:Zn(II)2Cys6 transcription factor n=1 Tax=Aspergillus foveolatus TaxID=210207 RepID=UPI003CCC9EF2
MVHRGKLSAACGPCRSRRLKCDHKRPSCSQCIRAKRECSGYRDISSKRFFDQTEEVKRKNSPSFSSSSSSSSTLTSSSHSAQLPPRQQISSPSNPFLQQQVSIPLRDQGAAFALSRYLNRSVGNNLPSILNTPSARAATASINAVGLAALSNIHQSPQLMFTARQEYGSALAETNAALSDPRQATSDASLVAVTFLGIFEIMVCDGTSLMGKFVKHMDGCSRIIQLRGSQQLEDPIGLGLFTQSRRNIVLGNFWLKRSTPRWLVQLSHGAFPHRHEGGDIGMDDALFLLMSRVGDLCASLKNGALIEPTKLVKRALKLDAELAAWAKSFKLTRGYTVVNVPERMGEIAGPGKNISSFQHIYGSHYHIYPDTVVSACWNDYRFVHLLLLGVLGWIAGHLSHKEDIDATRRSEYRETVEYSTMLSQQLSDDVCASVPYHFGATETSSQEDWSSSRTGGMVRLLWPLFLAAERDGVTQETRDWIADMLFRIGYGVGIRQALVMSNLLRSESPLSWLPELARVES